MDMLFFDNIDNLGRIVLTAVMVYALIVITTKISGNARPRSSIILIGL